MYKSQFREIDPYGLWSRVTYMKYVNFGSSRYWNFKNVQKNSSAVFKNRLNSVQMLAVNGRF